VQVVTKQLHLHGRGTKARTIESIVRAQVLLLVPVLLAVGVLCVQRRDAVGIAGMTVVAVALVAIARLLAAIPRDELRKLVQLALLVPVAALFIGLTVLPLLGLYPPLSVFPGS